MGFSDTVSQHAKTVRFVKLRIETFYGKGGGLRHLSFQGPPKKQGTMYKIILLTHIYIKVADVMAK